MERQRIHSREKYGYDEKLKIQARSDNKCCHCGKERYPGYGATIDHFIPLNQGGSNNQINLVMLCDECNQEKGEMIVEPELYLKYLKEPYLSQIIDYWKSYVSSFEYFSRRNLMACDWYEFTFYSEILEKVCKKKHNKKDKAALFSDRSTVMKLNLYRATEDDLPQITSYLIKYLKKYDFLSSELTAAKNVEFWYRFGCIYYTEKNGEINAVFPITIYNEYKKAEEAAKSESSFDKLICIFPIVYYSSVVGFNTARVILSSIPSQILWDQGLSYLPVVIDTVPGDGLLYRLSESHRGQAIRPNIKGILDGSALRYLACDDKYDYGTKEECQKLREQSAKILNRIPDKRDEVREFLRKNEGLDWMAGLVGTYPPDQEAYEAKEQAMESMRRMNANNNNTDSSDSNA